MTFKKDTNGEYYYYSKKYKSFNLPVIKYYKLSGKRYFVLPMTLNPKIPEEILYRYIRVKLEMVNK